MSESQPPGEATRAREHLANERTLLAWVRTSIALMGLGFVVARFGLFLREIAAQGGRTVVPGSRYSGPIGIVLVVAGVLTTIVSTVRFFRARAQIEAGRFAPEAFAEVAVIAITLLAGAALIAYLAFAGR